MAATQRQETERTETVIRLSAYSVPRQRDADLDHLSARELECAHLVAKGFSNKEVGQMLNISHWTVAAHLKTTYVKIGISRRTELAYIMRGLL